MYCKKTIAIGLSLLILLVSSVNIFALDEKTSKNETDVKEISSDEGISNIEDIVSVLDDVDSEICVEDVSKEGEEYVAEIENLDVYMPVEGGNDVELILAEEEGTIEIELPSMVNNMSSEVTADGSVYYSDGNSDASIILQAISEESEGESFAGIRQAVVIENADAPSEYDFLYSAGRGSRIVTGTEVEGLDNASEDDLYLVNDKGEILLEIGAPWAKDSAGKDVYTYYEVEGNTVTQIVEFDENSSFPIIADPTATAAKTGTTYGKYYYETKTKYASGQPVKGYKCNGYINVNLNASGKAAASVSVSYPIPGLGISVGASFSIPLGKAKGTSGSASSISCKIPDTKYYYKAQVTHTYRCRPWASWRQLARGKQVTDKGVSRASYAVKCVAKRQ